MLSAYVAPLFAGAVLGAAFTYFRLPLPAPPTLGGILGITGVWIGYALTTRFLR